MSCGYRHRAARKRRARIKHKEQNTHRHSKSREPDQDQVKGFRPSFFDKIKRSAGKVLNSKAKKEPIKAR